MVVDRIDIGFLIKYVLRFDDGPVSQRQRAPLFCWWNPQCLLPTFPNMPSSWKLIICNACLLPYLR
jgi:hypothetical protein